MLSKKIPNDADGRTMAEAVAERIVTLALKGDIKAITEITDRVEGKAMQVQQLQGPGGGAIPFMELTPEENEKAIAALLNSAAE